MQDYKTTIQLLETAIEALENADGVSDANYDRLQELREQIEDILRAETDWQLA